MDNDLLQLEDSFWDNSSSVRLLKRLSRVGCRDRESLLKMGSDGSLVEKLLEQKGFGKKTLYELRALFVELDAELKEPSRYKPHAYKTPTSRKTEREIEIYEMRKAGLSFREISQKHGISIARCSQVFKKACRRLGSIENNS